MEISLDKQKTFDETFKKHFAWILINVDFIPRFQRKKIIEKELSPAFQYYVTWSRGMSRMSQIYCFWDIDYERV